MQSISSECKQNEGSNFRSKVSSFKCFMKIAIVSYVFNIFVFWIKIFNLLAIENN